jgi:hypothetical protein
LTIEFAFLNEYSNEELMFKGLKRLLHLERETEMAAAELNNFVVDAVVKKKKKLVAASPGARKSMWKVMQDLLNGNWCTGADKDSTGANEDDEGEEVTSFKIRGLPPSEKPELVDSKPVIVLDDLEPFDPKGMVAACLRTVAFRAREDNVIVYMITNSKYAAYQIWQLNGGSKLTPLPHTVHTVSQFGLGSNPNDGLQLMPRTWEDWRVNEQDLSLKEKNLLKEYACAKVPNFAFYPKPFVFDGEAKKVLLRNVFCNATDTANRDQHIDTVVNPFHEKNIVQLIKEMARAGFHEGELLQAV